MTAKYAATSVHTYYATLKAVLESATEMELINRSPCKGVKLPPNKPQTKKVINPKEIHELAKAVGPE